MSWRPKTCLHERNLYLYLKKSKSVSGKSVCNKLISDKSKAKFKTIEDALVRM